MEDFEGLPNLFNALTSDSQDMDWRTFKFPIDFDAVLGGAKLKNKFYLSKFFSHVVLSTFFLLFVFGLVLCSSSTDFNTSI